MISLPDNPKLEAFIRKYDLKDVGESRVSGRSIYIMGDGGIGKTTLAGTIVDSLYGSPTFWFNIDNSVHVISHLKDKGIYVDDFVNCKTLQDQIVDLGKDCPFRGICLDNASALFREKLKEVTRNVDVSEWWTYYNSVTEYIVAVLEALQRIAYRYNCLVVVNMWTGIDKEESTGIEKILPQFNPATVDKIQGIPDILAHLTVEDDASHTRKLVMTPPSRRLMTKFRRQQDDVSMSIPDVLYGNPLSLAPLVDTLINGNPFPAQRFAKPTRATNKKEE